MARCKFSEYQFAFYHAREFDSQFPSDKVLFFPTAKAEKTLGYDFKSSNKYFNVFFQYKRPEFINKLSEDLKKNFAGGCFKISVFSKHKSDDPKNDSYLDTQYRTLKKLSHKERFVYYATPNFYKDDDFDKNSNNIIENSSHFRFNTLPNPNSAIFKPAFEMENHTIYYNKTNFKFLSETIVDIDDSFVKNIIEEIQTEIDSKGIQSQRFHKSFDFMLNLYLGDNNVPSINYPESEFLQRMNSFRSYLFRKFNLLWFPIFVPIK